MKLFKIVVIFFALLLCCQNALAIFCSQCGSKNSDNAKFCMKCGTFLSTVTKNSSSIHGNVYLSVGSGASHIQMGTEVFLIKDSNDVTKGIEKINAIEKAIASYNAENINTISNYAASNAEQYYQLLGFLSAGVALDIRHAREIYNYYRSMSFMSTRTDVGGLYSFNNLTDGTYYVFASCKTAFEEGYWIIKIIIEKGKSVAMDLTNFNFKNITNDLRLSGLKEAKESIYRRLEIMGVNKLSILGDKKTVAELELKSSQESGPILGGMTYPSKNK